MAFFTDDFNKVWASQSPLTPYEFTESNYKEGWNFVGGTPPSRQMWDFLQKQNDEKSEWLYNNKLDLSGGTIDGDLTVNGDFNHEETATLLGSSTTAEGAVAFGNIENLDYKRYLFTIDIQLSGEDFVRGTAIELSKIALLTNGAHAYNYGSSVAQNWCTLFFIVNPSIGVSYWAGGVTNQTSTVTSVTFRVYGIK